MQENKKTPIKRGNTLLYAPNIIGYGRIVLMFISIWMNTRWFAVLYSISYILDALDGYAARYLKQESELGYILDMGVDRSATAVLMMRVCKEKPWLFSTIGTFLALDILSHMFCVVNRCANKISHKAHNGTGITNCILKIYYTRPILFATCFGAEAFLLGILCFPDRHAVLGVCGAVFMFKQVTNVLQFLKALDNLSQNI